MTWVSVTPLPSPKAEIMAVVAVNAYTYDGGGNPTDSLPSTDTPFLLETWDSFSGAGVKVVLTAAGGLQLRSGDVSALMWASDPGIVSAQFDYVLRLWCSSVTSTARVALYPADSAAAIVDSGDVAATLDSSSLKTFQYWTAATASFIVPPVVLSNVQDFPDPTPPEPLINPKQHMPYGISVDVVRATVTIGTLNGVGFDPGTSVDEVSNETSNRVITAPSLLAVYGSGVLPQDQVVINGVTYEVDGHPKAYRNPFTGREHGEVITLKLVEG